MKTSSLSSLLAFLIVLSGAGCVTDELEIGTWTSSGDEVLPAPPAGSSLTVASDDLGLANPSTEGTAIARYVITSAPTSAKKVSIMRFSFTVHRGPGVRIVDPRIVLAGEGALRVNVTSDCHLANQDDCTISAMLDDSVALSPGEQATFELRVLPLLDDGASTAITAMEQKGIVWREGLSDTFPLRDGADVGVTFNAEPQTSVLQ